MHAQVELEKSPDPNYFFFKFQTLVVEMEKTKKTMFNSREKNLVTSQIKTQFPLLGSRN
jgi:hypothetical protein